MANNPSPRREMTILDWCIVLGILASVVWMLFSTLVHAQDKLDGYMGMYGVGHEKLHHWYKTLMRPDMPGAGCCNNQDCRPTQARQLPDKSWEALKDGRWISIPSKKVLKTDSYDTQAHICAPPPEWTWYGKDDVFCFVPPSLGL